MATQSETTSDHNVVRKWTEERGGVPAVAKGTASTKMGIGVLRIRFQNKDDLEEISWEDFFKTFDERNLAFLYQDKTGNGDLSRFFKFVARKK